MPHSLSELGLVEDTTECLVSLSQVVEHYCSIHSIPLLQNPTNPVTDQESVPSPPRRGDLSGASKSAFAFGFLHIAIVSIRGSDISVREAVFDKAEGFSRLRAPTRRLDSESETARG